MTRVAIQAGPALHAVLTVHHVVDCRVSLRVAGHIFSSMGACRHFFVQLHVAIFIAVTILVEAFHDISADVGNILHNVIGAAVVLAVYFISIRVCSGQCVRVV